MKQKPKEPWEKYPDVWPTEASFFAYIRGQLRKIWAHYPAKLEWKKAQAFPPPAGYTGRAKKLCNCYYCGQAFAISHTEVDHAQMAGACSSWETVFNFLYNLLDCSKEWRITCKPCHQAKSYSERMNISFEEAKAVKSAIAIMKEPLQKQLDFLQQKGYNGVLVSTVTKRRKLIEKIFKEERK